MFRLQILAAWCVYEADVHVSNMDLLCQYSGSDSEDESTGNTHSHDQDNSTKKVTAQTTVKLKDKTHTVPTIHNLTSNANRQMPDIDKDHNDDCNKPSLLDSVNVTNSITTDDFFGINDNDDNSDVDIESETQAKTVKDMLNVGLNAKQSIYSETTGTVDHADDEHNDNIEIPKSDFWRGSGKKQDWTNPRKIWRTCSSENVTSSTVLQSNPHKQQLQSHSHSERYVCKRTKLEITSNAGVSNDLPNVSTLTKPLQKSCFYVHHKIAPALHNTIPNRVPSGQDSKKINLDGHSAIVNRIKWCMPQFSHLLLSVSMDRTAKIWNVFSNVSQCVQTFTSHTKAVKDCRWTDSGRKILTASYDKTVKLFDVEKGMPHLLFSYFYNLLSVFYRKDYA